MANIEIICCMKLIFLFSLGISPADAFHNAFGPVAGQFNHPVPRALPTVTCDVNSPQCCWVTRFRQLMGKVTVVDYSGPGACCNYIQGTYRRTGIPNVRCDSSGNITGIFWSSQGLKGPIPSGIEILKNLQYL